MKINEDVGHGLEMEYRINRGRYSVQTTNGVRHIIRHGITRKTKGNI
jgi:hypothetical protein